MIIGGSAKLEHIYLVVSIPPMYSVSSIKGYLMGKSALMILERPEKIKLKFKNWHFWSRGYYVRMVGMNETTRAKYVRDEFKHDQMIVRYNISEAEDPFRDS